MNLRRSLVGLLLVAALACGQVQAQEKYRVYFGTYTGKVSKGIYQCEMNLTDGSLSAATLAGETSSPSFLAFHPSKKFLYAVNEGQAAVSAFAIEPTGQFMLVANQSGGNVIVFRINQVTGELTPTGASVQVPTPVCVRFMELK